MNFAQNLVNLQNELLLFAYKLTADHEEANDLLQETSLKVLDNEEKYMRNHTIFRLDAHYSQTYLCAITK